MQVIHLERIRKARDQTLVGEDTGQYDLISKDEMPATERNEFEEEACFQEETGRPKRNIRKPAWLDDYVSSVFRSDMPKTKVTPRKASTPGLICPVCKVRLADREEFSEHVFHCASLRHRCETCGTTLKKLAYLRQHEKRQHAAERKIEEVADNADSKSDESESES